MMPGDQQWRRESTVHRKSLQGAATLLLFFLSTTIQNTSAVDSIFVRLVREAFGPGWWPAGTCPSPGLARREGPAASPGAGPCAVTLACWARGGRPRAAKQCGPTWLFTCCQDEDDVFEDNQIHVPPNIPVFKSDPMQSNTIWRRGPQLSLFRRRIDYDYEEESDCGVAGGPERMQKRIIGGRAAQLAEFPWQAHIRIGDYQCGGVLVSRWFVATAAHCVQRARTRDINVWLGALDTREQVPPAERHRVSQKIVHPLFRYRVTQPDRFDLALLRLSWPAAIGVNVLPVCLPTSNTWDDGQYQLLGQDSHNSLAGMKALVAGWGSTGRGGAPRGTHHLRSAIVPILSTEDCILWHKTKHISVEIHSEMICAGHSDGHQDACLGDSGGPLVVEKGGRYHLVGITSAGFGCGEDHQPGIYHSVLVTAPWIRRIVWG